MSALGHKRTCAMQLAMSANSHPVPRLITGLNTGKILFG
jgi:hypothetical protein